MDIELSSERDDWDVLKDGGRIRVYKTTDAKGRAVVIKVYQLRGWLDRLSFVRKRRRLQRFYRNLPRDPSAEHLLVPDLLSSGVEAVSREGWICYSHVSGRDFRALPWQRLSLVKVLSLMRQAGLMLRALHDKGWTHGDFKFGNLLYCEASDSLYLLDIEDLRRSTSTGKKARDLARFLLNGLELSLPNEMLKSFWLSYQEAGSKLSAGDELKTHTKAWLEELGQRHQHKYQRSVKVEQLKFL